MFYKVVLNGQCQGQDNKNILYYRDFAATPWQNLMGGSEFLATQVKDIIWEAFKPIRPDDYTLESIQVYPYNELFDIVTQLPYELAVNEVGTKADIHLGPASSVNIRFNLKPAPITQGIFPPKFGYISVGPLFPTWVYETGYLSTFGTEAFETQDILSVLASPLDSGVPLVDSFVPIRVRYNRALAGLVKWESWADVADCSLKRRISFRRSRLPEA